MHSNSPYAHKQRIPLKGLLASIVAFVLLTGVVACSNTSQSTLATVEPSEDPADLPANPTVEPMPMATPAPTPLPSPTPIPTPTPTIFEQGEIDGITRSPFNGLAVDDESLSRRILVIKVDNHEEARPQSGIELTDMTVSYTHLTLPTKVEV